MSTKACLDLNVGIPQTLYSGIVNIHEVLYQVIIVYLFSISVEWPRFSHLV
jgi:hypothetical protein